MKKPRVLSAAEKEALVRRIEEGEPVSVLSKETGVLRKSLYQWKAAYRAMGAAGLNRKRGPKPGGRAAAASPSAPDAAPAAARPPDELAKAKARIAELERLVGRQQVDLDFFREALRSWDEKRRGERRAHLFAVVEKMTREGSQGETQAGAAHVAHLCAIAGLSRASYYRWLEPKLTPRDDADLARSHPAPGAQASLEGYRRITRRLQRRGRPHRQRQARAQAHAGRQPFELARASPFVPADTDSRHPFPIAPNLARGLEPTGLDQLWVADITYVRLAAAFVYLAVVIDAFSRKVVGWALDSYLEARLALEALDKAIAARDPPQGLIHHSDRGVQYACADYAAKLDHRGFQRSMSRPSNPYDNAKAESFMKTLKAEEANGKAYVDLEDARANISAFIDDIYNADRLHSALDYKSPVAFEAEWREAKTERVKPCSPRHRISVSHTGGALHLRKPGFESPFSRFPTTRRCARCFITARLP